MSASDCYKHLSTLTYHCYRDLCRLRPVFQVRKSAFDSVSNHRNLLFQANGSCLISVSLNKAQDN